MTETTGDAPASTGIAPDAIDGSFVPAARSGVAAVELDGEAVLYEEGSGGIHVLNPTATVIWSCFDGTGSLDELIAEMAEAYQVDPSLLRDDVIGLARQLGAQGLLEGVAVPDAEDDAEHDHGHHHDHRDEPGNGNGDHPGH